MQLFYALYNKYHNKEHSEFYLEWIDTQLSSVQKDKKKISFNCDAKTMINTIYSLSNESSVDLYNEYYGHFNSPQVFSLEIQLRKLESLLRSAAINKNN